MSGDAGLDEPIIFYSKKMTKAKLIVLEHKGIQLAYKSLKYTVMQNILKHWKLKILLVKLFPGKKIVITDNKDGSQTISIT